MSARTILVLSLFMALLAAGTAPAKSMQTPNPGAADRQISRSEQEFCRLDTNGDREISYEEFAECQFYRLEHVKRLPFVDMEQFPKDKNGNVSEEDLKRRLFERADRNKDRKIDRNEWEEFYNSLTNPY